MNFEQDAHPTIARPALALPGARLSRVTFREHGIALVGAPVAAALLALGCYAYLRLGAYIDHIEGAVVVSGWEYAANGVPLYQLQAGVPRFSTYYGPLAYLVEDLVPLLLHPGIAATKIASMLAMLGTVAIMAKHFFRRGELGSVLSGLFYLFAGLLLFVPVSFWVRPDPFETLLVASGVALAASPLAVGICIGLAVNFKLDAFVYFLPIILPSAAARDWRSLAILALVSVITFLLPFLAPGISLHDYIAGLAQQIGGRGVSTLWIAAILGLAAFLALPVFYSLVAQRHPVSDRIYALATLATLVFLLYPATFPGAGPYHFLPLVPVLAEALTRLKSRPLGAGIATLPMIFFGLLAAQSTRQTMAERSGWDAIVADALMLARQVPTRAVQIGYGETRQSYYVAELNRAVLTLNGYPAVIDAQILMELGPIGIDGSKRWVASLARCDVQRWLLPRGQKPFALKNFLYGLGPIFDPDFRRVFLDHYRVTASDRYFDVWGCASSGRNVSSAD
jgi:hypothetical protein